MDLILSNCDEHHKDGNPSSVLHWSWKQLVLCRWRRTWPCMLEYLNQEINDVSYLASTQTFDRSLQQTTSELRRLSREWDGRSELFKAYFIFSYFLFIISVDFVCLSMSVCLSNNNFWKPWRRKFIFAHPVYRQAIHCVGHRVTGAENLQNAYSRIVNFDRL